MDERTDDGLRDWLSARGEDALGEFAQALLDNPLLHQALQVAFEARGRAQEVGAQAIEGLNLPTAAETERLERRLRAVSERLETVEDYPRRALTRTRRAARRG